MNLRSGRDRFDAVFSCVKGDWPTIKQAHMLAIETTNMDEFVRHCKWLMDKGLSNDKVSSRLATMFMIKLWRILVRWNPVEADPQRKISQRPSRRHMYR